MQIAVYAAYLRKKGISGDDYWLKAFLKFTRKQDIHDVVDSDVREFCESIRMVHTPYAMIKVHREINNLRRYYCARSKNIKKSKGGRPFDIDKIMLVKNLSKNGLSVRKISATLGFYPTQVQRWNKFPEKKLEEFSPT